jgi:hypothetical protein
LVGSSWYVITGHDDVNSATSIATNLQRAYYVRDASSTSANTNIVSRAMYGIAGDAWQRGNVSAAALYTLSYDTGFTTQVSVSSTTATAMLNGLIGTINSYDYGAYRQTFVFGESLGSALANVDQAETLFPGGWPKRLVGEALLTDITPMMFPNRATASVSAGGAITAGVYGLAIVYKITDNRGNISRSAPTTTSATTAGGNLTIALVVPYLRHLSSNTGCSVEIYATAINGSVYLLHETIDNVPTSDSVTRTYTAAFTAGEALYTSGGVLSNYPVPPFRASFTWNDRQWALGTELESEAWHTKQFASGIAPEYAPPLKVTTFGGSGSLLAGGVINADYAVLFKRDAVFGVTGSGPDDTGGGGSFQVRRASWDGGCTNHASVVNYPGGCLFQGLDGVIYRINGSLTVDDPGSDAQDYAGATVYRAINLPKYGEVRFYLSTGKILVLDYGQANENAPNGYWYLDSSTSWGAGVGAIVLSDLAQFVDGTGVVWVEGASQFYDGSTTPILQKTRFNSIQPFGLGVNGRLASVQMIGEYTSANDLRISVGADGATAVDYDRFTVTSNQDTLVRPGGCGRLSTFEVTIEERGTGTGAGYALDGLVAEVQSRAQGKKVNSTQRV